MQKFVKLIKELETSTRVYYAGFGLLLGGITLMIASALFFVGSPISWLLFTGIGVAFLGLVGMAKGVYFTPDSPRS